MYRATIAEIRALRSELSRLHAIDDFIAAERDETKVVALMIVDDLGAHLARRVDAAAAGAFSLALRNATSADLVLSFISLNANAPSPLGKACAAILAMAPPERRATACLIADTAIAALEARHE